MKQKDRFIYDMLDFDTQETAGDILWKACNPVSVEAVNGSAVLKVPFQAQNREKVEPNIAIELKIHDVVVRAYGDSIIRVSVNFNDGELPGDESPMFEWDPSLKQEELTANSLIDGWDIYDSKGNIRMRIDTSDSEIKKWSSLIREPFEAFNASVFPDGKVEVPFMSKDTFTPDQAESVGLGYVEKAGRADRSVFSMYAAYNEKFAGTGERFNAMNLSGKTFVLENTDALGVNSRRAYKNVPFYVSSRPYGLLALTSSHVRLSLADISTRAAQGLVENGVLDLFFFGGGSIEKVVWNYRRVTGFPRVVPLWSYGTWMSRMTYFSADETRVVANKMREGGFPCDVLHLDTGWFKEDWKCEWEFNPVTFPNPKEYMEEMLDKGFRITLWQNPTIARDTKHFETARKNRYVAPIKAVETDGSDFGNVKYGGKIDFTNPEAVKWYKGLLKDLLEMGASAIKTDFGEKIDQNADYYGMSSNELHNLYCLLYQRAAFEITEEVKGEGIIWARAGWTGCQRYPIHWGGDCAATWDGLAGTIRGGLHIGVSGFAFWSHDVPGFHGLPDFMNSWPENDLYVRWTQVGVFTSHIRYHGTSPREPYEYPEVAPIVREWLKLRYALIPYLADEGIKSVQGGYPVFRAMIFHHEKDPFCWNIDDQFYCGDNLLIAPVLNDKGIRDVYLPEGKWTDFWTGEVIMGPVLLKDVKVPLDRIPVYARTNCCICIYPEQVQSTNEMNLEKIISLRFDDSYKGLSSTILGSFIEL
jgi:alpha-D-xyloside xylohydrolase